MKGIVFQELVEMMEAKLGPLETQQLIDRLHLHTQGAYAATGTYDHAEIIKIVGELSQVTGIEVKILVKMFGSHLHSVFEKKFSGFYEGKNLFSFLSSIQNHIHVEVRKLYPDAELPDFQCVISEDNKVMELTYSSSRPFADLAEGLILSSIDFFKEKATLSSRAVAGKSFETNRVFIITR